MCVVKIYIGEKKEDTKVMEEVASYEFNFKDINTRCSSRFGRK